MAEKEFITKLAARTAIENYACRDCVHSNGKKCEDCEYQDCINFINEVEAADVQPVKRGHWELIDGQEKWIQGYTCSECGQVVVTYECNFCPHCGADMREHEAIKG